MFSYYYQLRDKIKGSPLRQDKFILINFFIGLAFNIIIWLILAFNIGSSLEIIPLHYNIYFGIDLIGPWYKVFIIPTIGVIILFINILLSYIIYKKDKTISYFLMGASSLSQFVLLIGAVFVILLNL